MQGLGSFKDFIKESKEDCNNTTTIEDINSQYNYEDKFSRGLLDRDLMSCGQDGSSSDYNELQRFYDEHIPSEFKGLASHRCSNNKHFVSVVKNYHMRVEHMMLLKSVLVRSWG